MVRRVSLQYIDSIIRCIPCKKEIRKFEIHVIKYLAKFKKKIFKFSSSIKFFIVSLED